MKFEISVGLVCVVSAMRMPHFQKSEFSPTCWNAMQNLMSTQSNQWKVSTDRGFGSRILQKASCKSGIITWDASLCTKVCQLEENDPCVISSTPGFDICPQDLECKALSSGQGNTCQPLNDYGYDMSSYDDSSSFFGDSSSYDDFNFVKRSLEDLLG